MEWNSYIEALDVIMHVMLGLKNEKIKILFKQY